MHYTRCFLFTLLLYFSCLTLHSQGTLQPEWAKFETSPVQENSEAWGISIDSTGQLYWPFNSNKSNNGLDLYCHKLDTNGNQLWSTPFLYGGAGTQQSYVCNAKDTFVYIGGRYCPGTVNSCDMLLLKIDKASGNLIWNRTLDFGQNGYDEVDGLEIMPDGIYCGGWAQALDPGTYRTDIGLWKLDFNGNTIWTNHLGDTSTAEHQDGHFVVDGNHIYAAGLWGGSGFANLYNGHAFLGKFLRSDGSFVDSVLFGNQSTAFGDIENALGMTSDGTYLYITGYTTPDATNDWQIFIAKYDKNLNQIWYKDWGGSGNETARAIVVKGGYIYTAGRTESSEYTSGNKADAVLLTYDINGNFISHKTWGNPSMEHSFRDISAFGNAVYLSGTSKGDSANADSAFALKVNTGQLTSGISPATETMQIPPYPNPFRDKTNFVIHRQFRHNLQLKIHDLFGKTHTPEITPTSDGFSMRKGNLSPGIYLFEVMSDGQVINKGKLVIQ